MSQMPDGEVVTVPRSRIERTPNSFSRIDSPGTFFGGGDATNENGVIDLDSSDMGNASMMVRIVLRVPPLGPEDLL
jgi:hypothetical protein